MPNMPPPPARVQASATPITPDHARILAQLGPILPVAFKTGDRPKGTPGKKDFNMRDVFELDGPVYTHVLENIRKLCIIFGLDMSKTITNQEKARLHTLYSEAIRIYPGFNEFRDPVWPVEAFVYVALKGAVEKAKRVSDRAQAASAAGTTTDAQPPSSDPSPLAAGREARREAMRQSALARSAARKALAEATVDEAAAEEHVDSVEHVLGNMSTMVIGQDNALPANPAVVSVPVPAGGPSVIPASAASAPVPARPRPRPRGIVLPPAMDSGANPHPTPNLAQVPAHPSDTTNADAPADKSATTPAPVPSVSAPAPTSGSVPPADPAPNLLSNPTGASPAPPAVASTSTQVPTSDQAPIPLVFSGAPASVLARIPASLLPIGSPDPDTLHDDDDDDSLSDVPPDPAEIQTKGKRGSKAKAPAPKTTAKKAKANAPTPAPRATRRTTKI